MVEIFSYIINMNALTQFTACAVPVLLILLIILHKVLEKKQKSLLVWKLLCFLPLVICLIHLYFNALRGSFALTMSYYLPFTVAAVLAVFLPLFDRNDILLKKQENSKFREIKSGELSDLDAEQTIQNEDDKMEEIADNHRKEKKSEKRKFRSKFYKIYVIFVIVVSIAGSLYGIINIAAVNMQSKISNHTAETYTESFHGMVNDFRENYVLSEWKEIDYDEIEALLMPKVQKAQEEQDEVLFCMALYEFIYRIHDDHVWLNTDSRIEAVEQARNRMAGDDHGFAMFTTSDGETIAVLVDEESDAFEQGIRNGTVITRWNGEDVKSAASGVECIYDLSAFPVAKNEEWMQPLFLAGRGGEQVEVGFLTEDGQEKTVQIKGDGCYQERLEEAMLLFSHESMIADILGDEYDNFLAALEENDRETLQYYVEIIKAHQTNFETKMLTETTGYLRIDSEEYDLFKDVVSLARGSYPEIADMTSDKLDALKQQGMTALVIDARNNGGGFMTISTAVASLFTKERFLISQFASSKRDGGRMKESYYVDADGKWADLPVVLLTNYNCASSGDALVYALGKCENVTVMGITESNGICQSVGGVSYLTGSMFSIHYPMFLELDENGNPLIDTAADRIGRVPVDEFIPVDKEAALQIFGDERSDYELEYAVEYLSR